MSDLKVTHSSIEIEYDEGANTWKFQLRGRSRSAASLADARAAIDKEPATKRTQTFPRFDCYRFRYGRNFEKVTVTSIAEKSCHLDEQFWVVDTKGNRSKEPASSLYVVNEKNNPIIQAILDNMKQVASLDKARADMFGRLETASVPKELK